MPSAPTEPPSPTAPDHPRRAPGVRLCGRLRESGFAQPQWLVLQGDAFLQLPEPLYRLLEEATGRRSIDAIARRLTRRLGRPVSAATVERLIAGMLLPAGLVLPATPSAGQATAAAGARGAAAPRSSLALRLKRQLASPRAIESVTGVLQLLYWPPLLVTALVVAVLALHWVFVRHGVAGSVQALLTAPAQLLLAIALTIVGGAFHELGHAAALRYGGGRVRGMGVGLYLVYPAFYTDTTDAYRLGRWARVRTDLGGFYFNLLFILALVGLYRLTGIEALLVAAALMALDIVRQSLPFVRMDGYWALADLTGIPDFFSLLGPFLRSLLPLRWRRGQTLPPLKPWAKAVFAGYLIVTLPFLAFLLLSIVRRLPTFVMAAGSSSELLLRGGHLAWARGDGVGVAVVVVQLILLALPLLGMALMLVTLGRQFGTICWRWSRPTPLRRMAGAFAACVALVAVLLAWAPQLPPLAAAVTRAPLAGPRLAGLVTAAPAPTPLASVPVPDDELGVSGDQSEPSPAHSRVEAPPPAPSAPIRPTDGQQYVGRWQVASDGDARLAPIVHGILVEEVELFGDGSYCLTAKGGGRYCGRYHVSAEPSDASAETESPTEVLIRSADGAPVPLRRTPVPSRR